MKKHTSKVAVTENNRRFEVVVAKDCGADSVRIDTSKYDHLKRRCDYAVRVTPTNPQNFFFIELKGNDVIKAAEQLQYTVEHLQSMYTAYADRQAFVIAGGFRPAVQTKWQVIQRKLKAHNFSLTHHTKSYSVDLTK